MLVLSRKSGEQLIIGDNIVLTITHCGKNRVTVGIDAPRDVRILRGELEVESNAGRDAHEADQSALLDCQMMLPMIAAQAG